LADEISVLSKVYIKAFISVLWESTVGAAWTKIKRFIGRWWITLSIPLWILCFEVDLFKPKNLAYLFDLVICDFQASRETALAVSLVCQLGISVLVVCWLFSLDGRLDLFSNSLEKLKEEKPQSKEQSNTKEKASEDAPKKSKSSDRMSPYFGSLPKSSNTNISITFIVNSSKK